MLVIRRGLQRVSQSARPALALRAVPPTLVDFSSSSISANREHDSHDIPGAVTGVPTPAESRQQEELDAPRREDEASVAKLSPPEARARPDPSWPTPRRGLESAHTRRNRDWRRPQISPETKEYFCFVRIFGLSADMTLADILEGIARTAPVGRVLDIRWDKEGVIIHRGMEVKRATVLFDNDAAAADLVRLAKQQTFLVRGEIVSVRIWANRAFHTNLDTGNASRVLHLLGSRNVENFSEEGIRNLLMGNDRVVKALGPLGLDAEAVVTTEVGGGKRLIEWRFFSNEKQVKPVLLILRRLFYKLVRVYPGPDPCWNERLYPRGRTGNKDARHLFLPLTASGEAFKWPRVRGPESTSSDKHIRPSPADTVQSSWEAARTDRERESQLIEKLYGRRKDPVPLNKREEERISAWAQLGQLPKTGEEDVYNRSDYQQVGKPKPFHPELASTESNAPQEGVDPFEQVFKEALPKSREKRSSKF